MYKRICNSMLLINVCQGLFFMYKIIYISILLIHVYQAFSKFLFNQNIFKGNMMQQKVFFKCLNSLGLYLTPEYLNTF